MSGEPYSYSEYSEFNRFQNIDSIEWKIIDHFLNSDSKYSLLFWKLLKDNTMNAPLIDDSEVTDPNPVIKRKKRLDLVSQGDSGEQTKKRVFLSPFVDDAWVEQCSSVYIFVENLKPTNMMQSYIEVTVETLTHSKISVCYPEADEMNPSANPNDFTDDDKLFVTRKSRETMLLKCIIAELNGLYIDGIGYLQLVSQGGVQGKSEMTLFNGRSFYGHSTKFVVKMSNVSENPGFDLFHTGV